MPKATKKLVQRKSLKRYLEQSGLQKQAFAKMLGVSPATVSSWLYTDAVPSYPTQQRIAKSFGLSIDEVADFFPVVND